MRDDEDHERGLAFDLETMSNQIVARRRALAWVGGAGLAALVAAQGGGAPHAAPLMGGPQRRPGQGGSGSSSSSSSSSSGTTTSGSCIADAAETNGPYPADGTNTSSGSTSDILTQSGIVRSDIRSSFISSTTTAGGVQLTITLTLVNANNGCTPLSGYAIYLWHCDAGGLYSLYTAPTESYLRGVQVTNAYGQVTFTTVFPGCYSGRYPHIHFEVFKSLAMATSGKNSLLTSQLAMPSAVCSTVYNGNSLYSASIRNFASVSVANDNVFGDDSSAQITQMTPTMTGSVSAGYIATNTIGIAL